MMDPIQTERLELRLITEADAPLVLAVMNDPDFIRYVSDRGLRIEADAARYIREKMFPGVERDGFGMCVVQLKDSGVPIGTCGIFKRQPVDEPQLGFAFLPEFRARGFALEAAKVLMDYGRDVLKFSKIVAAANPNNASSIKLLEKLGMHFERMEYDEPSNSEMKVFSWERTG